VEFSKDKGTHEHRTLEFRFHSLSGDPSSSGYVCSARFVVSGIENTVVGLDPDQARLLLEGLPETGGTTNVFVNLKSQSSNPKTSTPITNHQSPITNHQSPKIKNQKPKIKNRNLKPQFSNRQLREKRKSGSGP
jgi:hypothetical protein